MNLFFQGFESREIMQVCSLLFHFLPKLLDRIVIRRVGAKVEDRQAVSVLGKELLRGGARVIPRTILNDNDVLSGLGENLFKISHVGR